jgi:putative ABC transport system permease protein
MLNRLVLEYLRQDPFAACIHAVALGFEIALILMLAGIRLTPTSHEIVGRITAFAVVLALIAFALLVSAGFRIAGRFTAVSERVRELGILRVLGASTAWILRLWLQETLVLAAAGALAGIAMVFAAKIAILYAMPQFLILKVRWEWWPVAGAIAAACDFIGASLSTWIALKKDLIEILAADI